MMSAGYHGYPRHLAQTRSRGSSGMLVLCMLPPPPSSLSSLYAVSSSSSEDVPMAASVADPDCPSSSSVSPFRKEEQI